jgi:transcriptional regulator with XRE-family HTH domain
MNLSQALRQALRDTGATLAALELRTGVSAGVLSRFMRGLREIGTGTVDRLCAGLRLDCELEPRRGKAEKGGRR